MIFTLIALVAGLVLGLIVVASNPSPYFGALGLVVVAGISCGFLLEWGGTFLSLVLFLIYLGGILVVFAYSTALATEPFPEGLGSWVVSGYALFYIVLTMLGFWAFWGELNNLLWVINSECGVKGVLGDSGVGYLFGEGGKMLIVGVSVLLLALFVVLELTRGLSRGTLRVVRGGVRKMFKYLFLESQSNVLLNYTHIKKGLKWARV